MLHGARTELATGEASTQTVNVERCAENVIDLGLEDAGGLVTAQVRAGDGVVTAEAMRAQGHLDAGEEVVHVQSRREMLGNVTHALGEVLELDVAVNGRIGYSLHSKALRMSHRIRPSANPLTRVSDGDTFYV